MEMLITDEMIDGLNSILVEKNSIVRVERNTYNGISVHIVFREDEMINNEFHPLNVSNNMIKLVVTYFKDQYGLEDISFNNTRTSFWIFG